MPKVEHQDSTVLTDEELRTLDAHWRRAANYLAVGQIHLPAHPLRWRTTDEQGAARQRRPGTLRGMAAVVFDTDGVITDSARVHAAAWKAAFHAFPGLRGRRPFEAPGDYPQYVDGTSRLDGAAAVRRPGGCGRRAPGPCRRRLQGAAVHGATARRGRRRLPGYGPAAARPAVRSAP
jgi:hypothetical protein